MKVLTAEHSLSYRVQEGQTISRHARYLCFQYLLKVPNIQHALLSSILLKEGADCVRNVFQGLQLAAHFAAGDAHTIPHVSRVSRAERTVL